MIHYDYTAGLYRLRETRPGETLNGRTSKFRNVREIESYIIPVEALECIVSDGDNKRSKITGYSRRWRKELFRNARKLFGPL